MSAQITINEDLSGMIRWSQNPGVDVFESMAADAIGYLLGPTLARYDGPWPLVSDIDAEYEAKLSIGDGTLY